MFSPRLRPLKGQERSYGSCKMNRMYYECKNRCVYTVKSRVWLGCWNTLFLPSQIHVSIWFSIKRQQVLRYAFPKHQLQALLPNQQSYRNNTSDSHKRNKGCYWSISQNHLLSYFMSFILPAWFGSDVLVSVYYSRLWHATTLVSFIYAWSLLPTKLYW